MPTPRAMDAYPSCDCHRCQKRHRVLIAVIAALVVALGAHFLLRPGVRSSIRKALGG